MGGQPAPSTARLSPELRRSSHDAIEQIAELGVEGRAAQRLLPLLLGNSGAEAMSVAEYATRIGEVPSAGNRHCSVGLRSRRLVQSSLDECRCQREVGLHEESNGFPNVEQTLLVGALQQPQRAGDGEPE
jgi:hypothetical protein